MRTKLRRRRGRSGYVIMGREKLATSSRRGLVALPGHEKLSKSVGKWALGWADR